MSSAKWLQFCLGLKVLTGQDNGLLPSTKQSTERSELNLTYSQPDHADPKVQTSVKFWLKLFILEMHFEFGVRNGSYFVQGEMS